MSHKKKDNLKDPIELDVLVKKEKKESERKTTSVSLSKILFHFSDKTDIFIIIMASFSSFFFGCLIIILEYLLANSINNLHRNIKEYDYISIMYDDIYAYSLFAVGSFFFGFGHCYFWNINGTKLALKYKEEYFKLVLQQDQEWFDNQNVHELSSKVDIQTRSIESGVKFIIFLNFL